MEPRDVGKFVDGKIVKASQGSTPGWLVLFFVDPKDTEPPVMMTIWVGGRKMTGEDEHHGTCNLITGETVSGGDFGEFVRDGRDAAS